MGRGWVGGLRCSELSFLFKGHGTNEFGLESAMHGKHVRVDCMGCSTRLDGDTKRIRCERSDARREWNKGFCVDAAQGVDGTKRRAYTCCADVAGGVNLRSENIRKYLRIGCHPHQPSCKLADCVLSSKRKLHST